MGDFLDDIKRFIKENDWGDYKRLDVNTSVEDDMKITGMDAVDFIKEYSQKFNVDISMFDYSKYFYAEGGVDLINPILNLFKKREDRINLKPKSLTLGDLAQAVQKGKLE